MEYSSCGVGFVVSLVNTPSHNLLQKGLTGLLNLEHRGGADASGAFGDGAGLMTNIPQELLGMNSSDYAVASIFGPQNEERFKTSLKIFEKTFEHYSLHVERYREVPTRPEVLDERARRHMPRFIHAFIKRPLHCRTQSSFDELLYMAKQMVRTKQTEAGIRGEFFFSSLSSRTIVYKALCTSAQLPLFYPDLQDDRFVSTFALFHRRFSTNTMPTWDKVQPFRLIAHNGEINTIEGNVTAAISRERAMGLRVDQLVTHQGTSDTGNLNNMVEALKYRSSIPHLNEILAIMIPPANWDGEEKSPYFNFWSRAMEPWDGPALVTYCDGKRIGARLDRSGFRPCRWHRTADYFYLSSEAGAFDLQPSSILEQGALHAGRSVNIHMFNRSVNFNNPDQSEYYKDAAFDARLENVPEQTWAGGDDLRVMAKMNLFHVTREELLKELVPTLTDGKEPIGSMGDTARPACLSDVDRSIYDYFYQGFAQVTNPPLDYIREKRVVDTTVILGRKPNIFEPKEMIPPHRAFQLHGPVLSLGQLDYLIKNQERVKVAVLEILFDANVTTAQFIQALDDKAEEAVLALLNGATVLVLSDRAANNLRLPLPALFVLRAVNIRLNQLGIRLKTSIIIDSGEVRNAHHIAVLVSFGASAVCPYLALGWARLQHGDPENLEKTMINALSEGLLKIMAKRGISVIRSYQGSQLFSILGMGQDILSKLFPKHAMLLGGLTFDLVLKRIRARASNVSEELNNLFLYKEHPNEKSGEKHSMTTKRAKMIHEIIKSRNNQEQWQKLGAELGQQALSIRDLFDYVQNPIALEKVEAIEEILPRFGTGAMSFGSISAEAQRDLILAFKQIGGRSNSGEGGENPFYYEQGISASIKQIASGRFGVTAEYLITGNEVQIKVAQGAKPGEGGQLMGAKVSADIARARHSKIGISLISPPPHHDIYSIEDLKQLIYELKQLKKGLKVSVKLVSGANIGAVALGVVKAGADIIQISGGSGGTGAASLLSMKHAGLPFEIGLLEVHRLLTEVGLRQQVVLRTDGGLFTGLDIIKAALLGADEFDFGKVLLVSQGCIMARVCEKNTCPTGIATQDPKYKTHYKGKVEEIVNFMHYLANEVQKHLALLGVEKMSQVIGRYDLLKPNHKGSSYNLDYFAQTIKPSGAMVNAIQTEELALMNQTLLKDLKSGKLKNSYDIRSTDRAVGANLAGLLALEVIENRQKNNFKNRDVFPTTKVELSFRGSAGQGFGVFCTHGMNLFLAGEANDSVAKSMSGGKISIVSHPDSKLDMAKNVLVGNACLYGATGGKLFLAGLAGDRFAIRNSGAIAVVHGVGLHACEYMTGGKVIILGRALHNIGAGMTGGELFLLKKHISKINKSSISQSHITPEDELFLKMILEEFVQDTQSPMAKNLLFNFADFIGAMTKYVPC